MVALVLVAGTGVWLESGGSVGRGFAALSSLLFGDVGVLLPLVVVVGGVCLLHPLFRPHGARITAGALITVVGASGLWHLAQGAPPVSASLERLSEIGGVAGAMVARPLTDLASLWVAGPFLTAVVLLGAMILTRTPFSRVWGWLALGGTGAFAFTRGLLAGDEGRGYGEPPAGRLQGAPVPQPEDGEPGDEADVEAPGAPEFAEGGEADGGQAPEGARAAQ